jgi:hypothetical protein
MNLLYLASDLHGIYGGDRDDAFIGTMMTDHAGLTLYSETTEQPIGISPDRHEAHIDGYGGVVLEQFGREIKTPNPLNA